LTIYPKFWQSNKHLESIGNGILAYDGLPAFSEAIWMPKWPKWPITDMGIDFYQFYTQLGFEFPIKIDHISKISTINPKYFIV